MSSLIALVLAPLLYAAAAVARTQAAFLRRAYGVGSIDEEWLLSLPAKEMVGYMGNLFTAGRYFTIKRQSESMLLQADTLPHWAVVFLVVGIALSSRDCGTWLIRLALWGRAVVTRRPMGPWSRQSAGPTNEGTEGSHPTGGPPRQKVLGGAPPSCDVGLVAARCVRFEACASKPLALHELWLGGELGEVR